MGQGEGFGGAYCYAEGWVGLSRGYAKSVYVLFFMNIAYWSFESGLHEDDAENERMVGPACSTVVLCSQDHVPTYYQCIS
jgi:hypothetical protein